jgi:hypothetical protein
MDMENHLWIKYILSYIFKHLGANKDINHKFLMVEILN